MAGAEPRSFGFDSVGSTGHFRRTPGRSPSVLKAAPQAAPQGIFLARPEQPAEGIRLAVKDLFDTAGLTTTYGSIVYGEHVPDRTAEAVSRLEAAGYANVGKTNLHEFAYGITSVNPHYGTVPNPAYPGRMAGGSSGGSATASRCCARSPTDSSRSSSSRSRRSKWGSRGSSTQILFSTRVYARPPACSRAAARSTSRSRVRSA